MRGQAGTPVSPRRPTSRSRFSTADRPGRVSGSHPELFALPSALEPTAAICLRCTGRRTHGFDRVGRSTQLVSGNVRHNRRLAGGKCSVPSSSAQLPCRSHAMATGRPGLRHPDLTACPCAELLDRLARSRVGGLHRLEQVQNVLRARTRPQRQEPVVKVPKGPTAADGDEAGVAIFGKDHGIGVPWRAGLVGVRCGSAAAHDRGDERDQSVARLGVVPLM